MRLKITVVWKMAAILPRPQCIEQTAIMGQEMATKIPSLKVHNAQSGKKSLWVWIRHGVSKWSSAPEQAWLRKGLRCLNWLRAHIWGPHIPYSNKSKSAMRTNVAQFQLCWQKSICDIVYIYDKTPPGICMVTSHMETSWGDWKNPTPGYQKSCHVVRPPLWRTTEGATPTHSRIPNAKGDPIKAYKYMKTISTIQNPSQLKTKMTQEEVTPPSYKSYAVEQTEDCTSSATNRLADGTRFHKKSLRPHWLTHSRTVSKITSKTILWCTIIAPWTTQWNHKWPYPNHEQLPIGKQFPIQLNYLLSQFSTT